MKATKFLLGVFVMGLISGSEAMAQEKIGQVHFPISCSAAAQQEFDRAVAMLHSFWFDASARAFAAVTQMDPGCAMGYWGQAMATVFSPNPFTGTPTAKTLQEGCPAVERAKASDPKTPREREYIAAVDALCQDRGAADPRAGVGAYAQAMERLVRTYPDDREAAIFYALALNITAAPADKTYANQLKAAAILETVFAEQPNHPGAAHYLIHSYDYPPIARRGLAAARRYASIAPAAPHALHMPAHIFTREGVWQESIESNRASAAAAKNHFDQLHAMDYLAYAYLQTGQDLAAQRVLEDARAIRTVTPEHFVTGYALAAIPARYTLERRRWREAASLTLHPTEFSWDRFPQSEAVLIFARALGASRSGNAAVARKDMERLGTLRDALVAAKQGYWAEQVEIQRQVVSAWVARAEGKSQEALALLRAAADREDQTEKHPVTPGPIVPARELLGELLLDVGDSRQALTEFERSHRVEPNRFKGWYGAGRAAELSGDHEKARTYYANLLALSKMADTERPELKDAKAFLVKK